MRAFLRATPRSLVIAAAILAAGLAGAQPKAERKAAPADGGERGVLVAAVRPGSPAEKAGIVRGDIILEAGGAAVDTPEQLKTAVDGKKPGDSLKLKVRHGDSIRTAAVTLAEQDGRALIGVVPVPVAPGPPAEGALVATVIDGGPAATAGLAAGDLILSVDGTAVGAEGSLSEMIGARKAGDVVTLSVQSPGKEPRDLRVTLGKKQDSDAPYLGVEYTAAGPRGPLEQWNRSPRDGGIGMMAGVLVAKVSEDSPAAKAGLKENDLITAVEGVRVRSPQDVAEAVAAHAPGDSLTLTVSRMPDAKETTITATLGANPSDKAKGYLGISMSPFLGIQGPERPDADSGLTPRMPHRMMPWRGAPGQPGRAAPAPNPPGI